MKLNEQVNKLKALLAGLSFNEAPAAGDEAPADTLKDYTTQAGAVVKIDRLEVGGKVVAEDGTTPITAGVTLADGTNIALDEAGVITAVTAPVAAEAVPPVLPPGLPAGFAERFEAMEKRAEDLEKLVMKIKENAVQKFKDTSAATEGKLQQFSEALTQVVALCEQFAAQPADDPAQPPAGGDGTPSKADRREAFAKGVAARIAKA